MPYRFVMGTFWEPKRESLITKCFWGTSLMAHWLRFCTSNAGDKDLTCCGTWPKKINKYQEAKQSGVWWKQGPWACHGNCHRRTCHSITLTKININQMSTEEKKCTTWELWVSVLLGDFLRTIAPDTAAQTALKNCAKEERREVSVYVILEKGYV